VSGKTVIPLGEEGKSVSIGTTKLTWTEESFPNRLRQGVQFSTANSDFRLVGYTATNSFDDSPDCHGGKNHRGLIADFATDKSCKIGNVSYPTGDQDITIQNGWCTLGLRVQGGSRVTVANCTAQAALLATIRGQETVPNNCSFTNCVFSVPPDSSFTTVNFGCTQFDYNDEYPISGSEVRRFAWLSFNNCRFEMNDDSGGRFNIFIEDLKGDAQVTFNDCRLHSNSETTQITIVDSDDVWDGLLSLDFWSSTMTSGSLGNDGADNAIVFEDIGTSDVEAIVVECFFENYDSPSQICAFDPGTSNVSRLINRNNSPTAWS